MEGFGGLGKIRGMLRFDIFFPLYVLLLYVFFFHFCFSNATTMPDCTSTDINVTVSYVQYNVAP